MGVTSAEELRILGPYLISREIGRGRFGIVLKAQEPNVHIAVALRLLPLQWSDCPDFLARFIQATQNAALLNHPHIMEIYRVGEVDDLHYMAMQYLPGQRAYVRFTMERDRPLLWQWSRKFWQLVQTQTAQSKWL